MIPDVMQDGVLIHTDVALHALGADDPRRDDCRRFLARVTAGPGHAYASTEMIQELVHHRLRATARPRLAASDGRALMSALTLLAFDYEVLETSLELVERLPGMGARDAAHAATALVYGIPAVASSDRAFDLVPGLTRIDPSNPETSGAPQR